MPSIFLAHSSKDKAFARRLAKDLKEHDIHVWIDEAEILVGDSLIEKLQEGIVDMQYLGVILSPNSVKSEWVQREVALALNLEIQQKKVKVLPIVYRECQIPPFLKDKLWADFRKPHRYSKGLETLLRRLAPIRRGFFKRDSAPQWTSNTLRLGLIFGVLREHAGQVVFSDEFLGNLCDESRKTTERDLADKSDYWGGMIERAVLYTGGKHYGDEHGTGLTLYGEEGVTDLINQISLNIIDYVAKIAIRAKMLFDGKSDGAGINPEFFYELFEPFKHGDTELIDADINISSSKDVRPYFIHKLIEEAKLRLIICDSESVKYHHLVGWLTFLLFDLNGWLEEMEKVVNESGE